MGGIGQFQYARDDKGEVGFGVAVGRWQRYLLKGALRDTRLT